LTTFKLQYGTRTNTERKQREGEKRTNRFKVEKKEIKLYHVYEVDMNKPDCHAGRCQCTVKKL